MMLKQEKYCYSKGLDNVTELPAWVSGGYSAMTTIPMIQQ